MSRSPSPNSQKINVRSIISIFENQSFNVDDEPTNLIRRTKSMGSLVQRPQITQRTVEKPIEKHEDNLELTQIDQQIQHLQNKLNNTYKTYSRDNHIYYQNQIIFVLTDLINVETRDIHKKSEMTETLKRLNMKLNAILPSGGGHKTVVTTSTPIVRTKTAEEKIKHVAPPPKKEQIIEQREEIEVEEEDEEEIALSVRSLKEKFEANSNESEAKREFGQNKITRYNTFNSIADLKYVTYSEKFKTNMDDSSNSFDAAVENSFPSQLNGVEDEIQRDRDSDSFSEQSSSSEEEEGQNGLENEDGEN